MNSYLLEKGIDKKYLTQQSKFKATQTCQYLRFTIPKKSGKKRLIEEPKEPLKSIQRFLIDILRKFSLHPSVYGLGGSSKDAITNASKHCNGIIVKMDIEKFFPSTTVDKFTKAIKNCTPDLKQKLTETIPFCFLKVNKKTRIPTGAPTSPMISSIAFTPVDYELDFIAKENNLNYTRYIDDLTFSGSKYPKGFQGQVNKIAKKYGYKINHDKSCLLYKDNNTQIVTGVCVNKKPNINKKYKKQLRVELDKLAKVTNKIDNCLQGKISYIRQLNPQQADKFIEYFNKRNKYWTIHDT